jgi:hypothetical protein
MYNADLYNSFASIRSTGGGIPSFWVGDLKTKELDAMTELLSQPPIAGIGITYSKSANSITVNTKVEFFEDAEGEYYLSVMVLESGIDGSSSAGSYAQSGTGNPSSYKHDFVLRASATEGNVYGMLILTNPTNGEKSDNEFTIEINSAWNKTVYPVAILWKKDDSSSPKYKFINAAS